jgi:hypothetical protein
MVISIKFEEEPEEKMGDVRLKDSMIWCGRSWMVSLSVLRCLMIVRQSWLRVRLKETTVLENP